MEEKKKINIITVGASAGGLAAVSRLVKTFNKDFDAAVFIVIHMAGNSSSDGILNIIQKQTSLPCVIPEDLDHIVSGTIYLAKANHHLLVEKGIIRVTSGAYENHWRPAIDVLFRSAAVAYSGCVTGIVLTGLLDDGTSGMHAIKKSGGRCMIQDPAEADFPDMPLNVLHAMEVDYKVSIDEMGYILADLFSRSACQENEIPEDIKLEAAIAGRMSTYTADQLKLGELTPLTCPDCGGLMVQLKDDVIPRYRCYTGHTFTERSLEIEQLKGIEESLWVAIRMLEERRNLLLNIGRQNTQETIEQPSIYKRKHAGDIQLHVDRLKEILIRLSENN